MPTFFTLDMPERVTLAALTVTRPTFESLLMTTGSPSLSVAASLSPDTRQKLAIEVLAKSQPISQLAAEHQVSGKFLYKPLVRLLSG